MDAGRLGSFIRDQRTRARLSLKSVSGLAGVSIPYLSQVERGLRRPSAEILQSIAKGLRISAETLYVQAGILEDRERPDVASAIAEDPALSEAQRRALLEIYQAFRYENGTPEPDAAPGKATASTKAATRSTANGNAGRARRAPRRAATKEV
ncbi:MAG TPA: helix-turn-helix transcriptional regulator [Actinomycetota bacterium]|jgi:transcriptional regulator with XRE-family HTH domain